MKLKIISDGTFLGTKLIDEETGEKVPYVQSIEWVQNVNEPFGTVVVKLMNIGVDIVSPAKIDVLEFTEKNDWETPIHIKTENKTIKTLSTGLVYNTTVSDANNDELIPAVQEITWKVDVDKKAPEAKLIRIKMRSE